MTAGKMQLSVVIPAYNAAKYLGATLESVAIQAHRPAEVVVVDDGSDDDLAPVLQAAAVPVRLIRQVNRGPAAARNSGLAATVNPFVAFLDADDLWPEGALDRLMAAAKEAPDAAAIHGRIRCFRDVRDTASTRSRREFGPPQHRIHLGSMLFARWALEKVGGLNEALRLGEDLELLVRLQSAGLARRTIPDVTLLVRRGHGGMTEVSQVPPATAHARIWARALADDLRRRRSK